jgi:hypothetical protein
MVVSPDCVESRVARRPALQRQPGKWRNVPQAFAEEQQPIRECFRSASRTVSAGAARTIRIRAPDPHD